jgi:uncharacterized protein (DUF58 family)
MIPSARLTLAVGAAALLFLFAPWLPLLYGLGVIANCALLAGCLVDALLLSRLRRLEAEGPLPVERECDPTLSLGVANPVRLRVRNRAPFPVRFDLKDAPPPSFGVDRRLFGARLRPGELWSGSYHVTPRERGDFAFGALAVRGRTPLGLLIRQFAVPAACKVKVYPNVRQIQEYEMLVRQDRSRQMGLRRARQMLLGAGLEFDRLRDYLPDDEPRRLDWKATARRGRLMTREFTLERSQNLMLVLDLGRTMASRLEEMTKVDLAVNACVLLAHIAAEHDDRVGLYTFAASPGLFLPPDRGRAQVLRLLDALYGARAAAEEANYRTAFAALAARQRKRSLILLFTDLIDPDSSRRLIETISILTAKHRVVCVAFGDHELGDLVRARPAEGSDLYRQAVAITMLEDRRLALAELSRRGVLTVDASPANLGIAAVNKYLELKGAGRV